MRLNIKGTGISLTPAISEYIEKKVNMLGKFLMGSQDILINMEVGKISKHHKSGDVFRAEIQAVIDGKDYYAVAETEDLYAAIDEVKDEIVREMTSKRKKTLRLFKKGGAKIKNLLKSISGLS